MYLCVSVYAHVLEPGSPVEGARPHGPGITGGCEATDRILGIELLSSGGVIRALNY